MPKSVIVYGPRGCGKTTNATRIAKALGLTKVIDGAEFDPRQLPALNGVLVLVTDNPVYAHEIWKPTFPDTMFYPAAMRRVERHEAGLPVH
jgi:Holliday junction resolvasome RuvABC ATP-dependent DNA helicase subunit